MMPLRERIAAFDRRALDLLQSRESAAPSGHTAAAFGIAAALAGLAARLLLAAWTASFFLSRLAPVG